MRLQDYICAEMKRLRIERGFTQEELAKKMGCHKVAVSKNESGKTKLQVDYVAAFAKALEIDPKDLFPSSTAEKEA